MHLRIRAIFGIFGIAACVSCSSKQIKAWVDDVAVPINEDSGYRVVAVDGAPEKRATSNFVTMIPIVELSPGEHNITVKKSNRVPLPASAPEMLTGKVNVEGSHRYRIRIGNGIVSLAEAK